MSLGFLKLIVYKLKLLLWWIRFLCFSDYSKVWMRQIVCLEFNVLERWILNYLFNCLIFIFFFEMTELNFKFLWWGNWSYNLRFLFFEWNLVCGELKISMISLILLKFSQLDFEWNFYFFGELIIALVSFWFWQVVDFELNVLE